MRVAEKYSSEGRNGPCCLDLYDLLGLAPRPEDADLLIDEPPLVRLNGGEVVLVLESLTEDLEAGGLDDSTAIVLCQHRLAGCLWTNGLAPFQCWGRMYLDCGLDWMFLSGRAGLGVPEYMTPGRSAEPTALPRGHAHVPSDGRTAQESCLDGASGRRRCRRRCRASC